MPELRRVCLYAGSSPGTDPSYVDAAASLARLLAHRGIGIAYGGASVGLMRTLADAAMAAGGEVIGVLPRALGSREIGHPGLTRLELVETMHERKARMAELSDAFIALPGGVGTLEELVEAGRSCATSSPTARWRWCARRAGSRSRSSAAIGPGPYGDQAAARYAQVALAHRQRTGLRRCR